MTKNFVRILVYAFLAFAVSECNGATVPLSELFLGKIAPQPQAMNAESRIIGGNLAKPATAPYIASMSISKIVYGHDCACVIISKDWLITAAHCIVKNNGTSDAVLGLPVYAGLSDRNDLKHAQIRYIDFAFSHKRFNGIEGSEDIALLHVSSPFEFNDNVRSIALPGLREEFAGELSTTYGWGLTNTDASTYVNELHVAHAEVIDHKECRKTMPSKAPVSPRTICARVASCYGDGGSPLVIKRNGYEELIGTASWGYMPCGYGNHPTAFIAVSHFVDWIAQVQWAYSILH